MKNKIITLDNILFTILFIVILLQSLFMFKISNTVTRRNDAVDAIYAYYDDHINEYEENNSFYDTEESFNSTVFRIWDWGNTRIVPPDVYQKIKPYIDK